MRRRDFITLLGGSAAWPITARAQQPALPVVGFFRSTPSAPFARLVDEFREGLKETGFVEGQNVAIEQRWANQLDQLPSLAADLVRSQVKVIVGNGPVVEAARAATSTIPIVFVIGEDPVARGLVASLNRPGGNLTGVTFFANQLGAKRMELLHELVPRARTVGLLVDTNFAASVGELAEAEAAARAIGLQGLVMKVEHERDFDAVFAKLVQAGAGALFASGSPLFASHRHTLIDLAARHAMPAIYDLRDYVEAGGLISYAASFGGAYRQAGVYAGRILAGAKPSELPVQQPTKFELVINLKTAKALGLTVPLIMQMTADEVIE